MYMYVHTHTQCSRQYTNFRPRAMAPGFRTVTETAPSVTAQKADLGSPEVSPRAALVFMQQPGSGGWVDRKSFPEKPAYAVLLTWNLLDLATVDQTSPENSSCGPWGLDSSLPVRARETHSLLSFYLDHPSQPKAKPNQEAPCSACEEGPKPRHRILG